MERYITGTSFRTWILLILRVIDTLLGEITLPKLFFLASEKGCPLSGKFAPKGNSFLLEYTLFQKDLVCLKANKESQKLSYL